MENEINNELNQEMNSDAKDEKPLYSINVETTLDNYAWAVKANAYTEKPAGIFLIISFLLSGIALLVFIGGKEYLLSVLLFTISFLLLFYKFVAIPKSIKRTFGILAGNNENENQYDIYEDHIVRINSTGTAIIKYDQINWISEGDKYICFFIPVSKVIIIDKTLCEGEAVEFIKDKADKNKLEKSRKAFKKKSIIIWILGIYVVLTTVFLIWLNKPLNDYTYSTYDSFVDCLEYGYVDEVIFHEEPLKTKTITYRYVKGDTSEYFNTVPPKGYDKERLLGLIEERGATLK